MNKSFVINRDRVRSAELKRPAPSSGAHELHYVSIFVELVHARVLVAIANGDIALGLPGDVGRFAEISRVRQWGRRP